jgi:hypothetical protein
MRRLLAVILFCAGIFCLAQSHAQVSMTGAGLGAPASGGGGGYTAQGVHFNGSTELWNPSALNAPLTGSVNSKVGIVSFWLNTAAGTDGTDMGIQFVYPGYSCFFTRTSGNLLNFDCQNASGSNILLQRSVATVTTSSGWTSVVASWDLSVPVFQLYINDSVASTTNLGLTNDTIAYASPNDGAAIGSEVSTNYLTGDLADFYFDQAHRLDLSVSANLQKFINGGNAVDLGTNCSNPTGSQPIICLRGPVATWNNNVGSGGSFAIHAGSLSAASSNPP